MQGHCSALNREGKPCSAQAWRDGLCRWHHPDLADERAGWRAKGGAERSNSSRARKALPEDLVDVRDALLRTLGGLENGEVEPRVAWRDGGGGPGGLPRPGGWRPGAPAGGDGSGAQARAGGEGAMAGRTVTLSSPTQEA